MGIDELKDWINEMIYFMKDDNSYYSLGYKSALTQILNKLNSKQMSDFKQYKRKGLSEMRPYVSGEDLTKVSVSDEDKKLETLDGGYVARNPKNHADQWYVAKKYFDDNLEPA